MININKLNNLSNFIIIFGFILIFITFFNFNIKLRVISMLIGISFLIFGIIIYLLDIEKQKKLNKNELKNIFSIEENLHNNKFIKFLVFIIPIILFIIITRNLNINTLIFFIILIIISFSSAYLSNSINKNEEKNWNLVIILSIFFGWIGLDRLYLQNRFGVVKLVTFGGLGIWWAFDILFILFNKIKYKNKILKKIGNRYSQLLLTVLALISFLIITYFITDFILYLSKSGVVVWK